MAEKALSPVLLENCDVLVKVDGNNGSITGIFDKKTQTPLITEERLAESFRLLVPLPSKESNYINGKEQKLSSWSCEGDSAVLEWKRPMAESRRAGRGFPGGSSHALDSFPLYKAGRELCGAHGGCKVPRR